MNYEQALAYTHSLLRFGVKPGLERVRALLARLGDPHKGLRVVHVAGTNGKGSTCAMLASVLRQAGLRTGLFISPYVLDFRERIQLDGDLISPADFAADATCVRREADAMAAAGEGPTEFEFITAVAFRYFARQGCDVAVLETGLGGRFDATNVVEDPLVSVITSLSLDHTDVLGDTIERIAAEKAGIIKPHGICVTCPDQDPAALAVLMQTAAAQNARLCMASANALTVVGEDIGGTDTLWRGAPLRVPFCGWFQLANALCVLETVERLREKGFSLPDGAVRQGLAAARMPARMEILCRDPLVVLDGTHNPGGAAAMADVLRRHLPPGAVAVWGMLRDKNYEQVVAALCPFFTHAFAVEPDNPRALDASSFADVLRSHGLSAEAAKVGPELLPRAIERAAGGPVMILGSFYLAAQMRPLAVDLLQKNT